MLSGQNWIYTVADPSMDLKHIGLVAERIRSGCYLVKPGLDLNPVGLGAARRGLRETGGSDLWRGRRWRNHEGRGGAGSVTVAEVKDMGRRCRRLSVIQLEDRGS